MKLCTCNNCGGVWEDMNPQIGAKEYEYDPDILPLVKCHSLDVKEPDTFWGCPRCGTDDFLSDTVDQALEDNSNNEPGAAQICIRLEDSEIVVFHTEEDGPVLFRKKAVKGDWDKIWDAIKS